MNNIFMHITYFKDKEIHYFTQFIKTVFLRKHLENKIGEEINYEVNIT
jgi:hypothetical protein